MKRIFYLRTYYQIIFVLQIVNTLCKNDEVTFLISDDSKGADGIVQDLCKFDIVRNILWVETKRLTYEKHMSEKNFGSCQCVFTGNESIQKVFAADFKQKV